MNFLLKTFYKLTASIPRAVPTTNEEYDHLKCVFTEAYGVPDSNACWATIASHLGSVPSFKLKTPWINIANAAKRLTINKLIQEKKVEAITALQEEYKKLQEAHASEQEKEEKKDLIEDVS